MPWNSSDYPAAFKNLDKDVRKKAIEIANALLREDYEESRAISIATAQAREYVHGDNDNPPKYVVKAGTDDWVFMKKDGTKAIFKNDTKNELLEKAKPYVNEHNGILSIYYEDGSLEDTLYG